MQSGLTLLTARFTRARQLRLGAMLAVGLSLFAYPKTSAASIIGVDIGGGTLPANWTAGSVGTFNNLVSDDGTVTSVDLTVSSDATTQSSQGQAILADSIPLYTNDLTGLDNYMQFVSLSTSVQAVFSSLNPGGDYRVWVFAMRNGSSTFNQNVTLTGEDSVHFTQTNAGNPAGTLAINDGIGNSSQTLASYAKVLAASSTGTLTIDISGIGTGSSVRIAGFALEALPTTSVPEPSTLVLMFVGLGAVAVQRLRRTPTGRD